MMKVKQEVKKRFEGKDAGGHLLLCAASFHPRYKDLRFLREDVRAKVQQNFEPTAI